MLREYIVTPDVLLRDSYEHPELYRLALRQIWEEVEQLGLLRNLAAGEWSTFLQTVLQTPANNVGKEVLKAALLRNRLIATPKQCTGPLDTEDDWRHEALNSHQKRKKARRVIFTDRGKQFAPNNATVASVLHLDEHAWWRNRDNSISVQRKPEDLRRALSLFFSHSRRIDFVDPYLSSAPDKPGYQDFPALISSIKETCRITLHARIDSVPTEQLKARFQRWSDSSGRDFDVTLRSIEAFTDPRVPAHDRYFISDLATLALTNGYDFGGRGTPSMTVSLVGQEQSRHITDFFTKTYGTGGLWHWSFRHTARAGN